MKKILIVTLAFMSIIIKAQNTTEIKLKLKVISILPVGWGYIYRGVIEEDIKGGQDFLDTITFGITASNKYECFKENEIIKITFTNSGKINKEQYLPAINGTISKKREIWYITNIEKAN